MRGRKRSRGVRRLWGCVVALSALWWASCSHPATVEVRSDHWSDMPLSEFARINFGPSEEVPLDPPTMAALSALAYEDEMSDRDLAALRAWLEEQGWDQRTEWSYPEVCNVGIHDLAYQAWAKVDFEQERVLFALVFRGTASSKHWCSNLRFLPLPWCPKKADQYLYVAQIVDEALRGLGDEVGDFDSYSIAIGHSLGGGLAELAGRASYIDLVFSFDSSPVVGSRLAKKLEQANAEQLEQLLVDYEKRTGCSFVPDDWAQSKGLRIQRIYEHGEILAYLRWPKRLVVGRSRADPEINEFRVDVLSGSPVRQHAMAPLACELIAASSENEVSPCHSTPSREAAVASN